MPATVPRTLNRLAVIGSTNGFPQTQQGADLLSSTLNTVVYMPDFFEPDAPYPIAEFPPKDEEGQKKLQAFFGSTAAPPKATANLIEFAKKLKEQGKQKVFAYGFCWGEYASEGEREVD